ncbi:unnamed protein product [Adineta steineri]|uniref:Uncharacterized protein n=1 Tax=Adineta steineri TaxID=433720 RepID=A0A815KAD5_9BILA|nr:unnamed protein product [Adineta steineri]
MGCFCSREIIDFDYLQPLVLRTHQDSIIYSGTTERGRLQTLGNAEIALTEDCLYSQVTGTGCCGDQGILRIPVLSIIGIRQQSYFNKRYRTDHPHMVLTYVVRDEHGKHEYHVGWQMNDTTFNQWKDAILRIQNRYPPSELG